MQKNCIHDRYGLDTGGLAFFRSQTFFFQGKDIGVEKRGNRGMNLNLARILGESVGGNA